MPQATSQHGHRDTDAPALDLKQDALFKKSSLCTQGACVEVAILPDSNVALRDSKDPAGPVLTFTADEWQAFTAGVKNNEFEATTR